MKEAILVLIGYIIGGVMFSVYNETLSEAHQAIQQCEQNLPRNQHCEAVVSARVVEE